VEKNGLIELDSKLGKEIGFTSNLFEGYLFKVNKSIYISLIVSKKEGKGNLTKLFNKILEKGYKIMVPTPLGKMKEIVKSKGFEQRFEKGFEVWEKG
jgi:hypothetical protein